MPTLAANRTRQGDREGPDIVPVIAPEVLSMAMSMFAVFLVVCIVLEKDGKHLTSMEVMGLRPVIYWLSWVIIYCAAMLVFSIFAMALVNWMKIWPNSNFLLLLLACVLYSLSIIAMGLGLSAFLTRPIVAGIGTFLLITVLSACSIVEPSVPDMSTSARCALYLLPPAAFVGALTKVNEQTNFVRLRNSSTEIQTYRHICRQANRQEGGQAGRRADR